MREIVGIPRSQSASMEVVYMFNKTREPVECDSPNGILMFEPGRWDLDSPYSVVKPTLRVHAVPICKRNSALLAYMEPGDYDGFSARVDALGGTTDAFFAALSEWFGVDAQAPQRAVAAERRRQSLLARLARQGMKFDKDEKLEVLEAAATDASAAPGLVRAKTKEEREAHLVDKKRKEVEEADRPLAETPAKQEATLKTELRARYKELVGAAAPRGLTVPDLQALVAEAEATDPQLDAPEPATPAPEPEPEGDFPTVPAGQV